MKYVCVLYVVEGMSRKNNKKLLLNVRIYSEDKNRFDLITSRLELQKKKKLAQQNVMQIMLGLVEDLLDDVHDE